MKNEKENVLIVFFFFSHKNDVKTFLKWFVNNYPKNTH